MATRVRYQEFFYVGSPSGSIQYFNVPYNVSCVHITMVGGGGGGGSSRNASSQLAAGAGGGGGGEFCIKMPVYVTPGASVEVQVGEGGVGATRPPAQGSPGLQGQSGGITRFGKFQCAGGVGGGASGGANALGGNGGGPGGATGASGDGPTGATETMRGFFGGSAGGGYVHASNARSSYGGRCAGMGYSVSGVAGSEISPSSPNPGGGAGASSMWGYGAPGGDCGDPPADNATGDDADPSHYGAGGGGGGTDFKINAGANAFANKGFGGDGAPGYLLVTWLEDDSQGSP